MIDEDLKVIDDTIHHMSLSRQQLTEALFQMNDRYNQLVNSDENQDEVVMQQVLRDLVGEND